MKHTGQAIAVIGMAGRFPGAPNLAAYRALLRQGGSGICTVPPDRWDAEAFYSPGRPKASKMNSTRGGFLDDVRAFDAGFFNIAPAQARAMDPQQRILLETSWAALESANLQASPLAGSLSGVFVGVSNYDYGRIMSRQMQTITAYSGLGTVQCILANRFSYFLKLNGPSLVVDTACSSSLVSVHLACQSLACGEIDLAFAGGINIILAPEVSIGFARAGMLSPDGECKAFDAAANGYVRSEGCGMVLLKRLEDAEADHDPILAVILGSATNHNGLSNGMAAPSTKAQRQLIELALERAKVAPHQIEYVEAHGTGTVLGDPIEMEALKSIFKLSPERQKTLAVGSVKNNIGHLESGAGIAGFIKAVLCVHDGMIPLHRNFQQLNPLISLADSPIRIPTETESWTSAQRLAGVSSFGFGGANAHLILQNYSAPTPATTYRQPCYPVVLSAKSSEALHRLLLLYRDFLDQSELPSLAAIGRITTLGRTHFLFRWGSAVATIDELKRHISDAALRAPDAWLRNDSNVADRGTTISIANADDAIASFVAGGSVDWRHFYPDGIPMREQLPHYPFGREHFWMRED